MTGSMKSYFFKYSENFTLSSFKLFDSTLLFFSNADQDISRYMFN